MKTTDGPTSTTGRDRLGRLLGLTAAVLLGGFLPPLLSGCRRPSMPSLTGKGRFHDISQVRLLMSPNEVRRVMGSNYKEIWKEGLQGVDMGRYAWEYPEGLVYFDPQGVTKVVPYEQE